MMCIVIEEYLVHAPFPKGSPGQGSVVRPKTGGDGGLGDPVVTTALPPGLAFRGRAFRQALALL